MAQGFSNTFNAGVLGVPWVFSSLLLLVAFMLGVMLSDMRHVQDDLTRSEQERKEDMKKWTQELRILQVHMENTNAILLREGIKKPDDDKGSGPTGVH